MLAQVFIILQNVTVFYKIIICFDRQSLHCDAVLNDHGGTVHNFQV